MTVTEITGDLLKLDLKPTDLIVHQANCRSSGAKGLAFKLFNKYPRCNVYKASVKRTPGSALITPPLAHLFGEDDYRDTALEKANRPKWFQESLDDLASQLKQGQALYFPYKIGCGLAGGNWKLYRGMIEEWSRQNNITVYIVKRPEDE